MDTFEMLKRLLSQNEFELLLPDQTGAKEKNTDKTDIRLVYQMKDTIESFLVFKEARMTGTYKEDYEGALIVALKNGQKMELSEAISEYKKNK